MMKSLPYIAISTLVALVMGCDYVNKPTNVSPQGNTGGTGTSTVVAVPRKVLIEDYTGHTCGNCPKAAISADNLENTYHSNVIIIAVHAGFFAQPGAAPYTDDYRSTTGTDWDNFFGIGAAGNPNGMINRKDYPTGNHIKAYSSWSTDVAPYINQPADAKLTLVPTYNASAKTLDMSVKTKFINALTNNYKLSVVLTEDSITGPQKDYTQNPDEVPNYVFKHMLRGGINGSWGDALNTAPVAANDSITKTYSAFAINPAYNDNRLYVVAFVYNAATYEVIQVEKVKIR